MDCGCPTYLYDTIRLKSLTWTRKLSYVTLALRKNFRKIPVFFVYIFFWLRTYVRPSQQSVRVLYVGDVTFLATDALYRTLSPFARPIPSACLSVCLSATSRSTAKTISDRLMVTMGSPQEVTTWLLRGPISMITPSLQTGDLQSNCGQGISCAVGFPYRKFLD